jgi:N-methylhydantoinase A
VPYEEEPLAAFHRLHQKRYGFCDESKPVEVVNLRLRMTAPGESYTPPFQEPVTGDGSAARYAERAVHFDGGFMPTPHYARQKLVPGDCFHGPSMITEYTSATALPPGWRARVDGYSNLVLEKQS